MQTTNQSDLAELRKRIPGTVIDDNTKNFLGYFAEYAELRNEMQKLGMSAVDYAETRAVDDGLIILQPNCFKK